MVNQNHINLLIRLVGTMFLFGRRHVCRFVHGSALTTFVLHVLIFKSDNCQQATSHRKQTIMTVMQIASDDYFTNIYLA